MKIFTTQERTIVIILASLFILGMAKKVTVKDLMLVPGIGSKTFEKLLSYIQVN